MMENEWGVAERAPRETPREHSLTSRVGRRMARGLVPDGYTGPVSDFAATNGHAPRYPNGQTTAERIAAIIEANQDAQTKADEYRKSLNKGPLDYTRTADTEEGEEPATGDMEADVDGEVIVDVTDSVVAATGAAATHNIVHPVAAEAHASEPAAAF